MPSTCCEKLAELCPRIRRVSKALEIMIVRPIAQGTSIVATELAELPIDAVAEMSFSELLADTMFTDADVDEVDNDFKAALEMSGDYCVWSESEDRDDEEGGEESEEEGYDADVETEDDE